MSNPYEESGRLKKALAFADILSREGILSWEVAGFTEGQWGLATQAAQFKKGPSDETKAMIVEMLRKREK